MCGLADEVISGKNNEERIAAMIAYSTWAESEAFSEGYVWGYRKGCLNGYEKCLKMLDERPDELRAMLESEISRLCQEIEAGKE